MAFGAYNRVYVNTATAGTGTVTPGAVVSAQFNTFADAGVPDGKTVTYILEQGTDYEIGRGVYNTAGPTLTRATVLLSRIAGVMGTTKLTLGGSATIRVTHAAEDVATTQGPNTFADTQTFTLAPVFTDQTGSRAAVYAAPLDAIAYQGFNANYGCEVAQEFGSASTVITATGSVLFYYPIDVVSFDAIGTFVFTAQQVTDAPPGFANSLSFTVTTAQASLGTTNGAGCFVPIEGTFFRRLGFGAAGASPATYSVWLKSHRTGPIGMSLKNAAGTRSYPFNVTINAADTWEFKTGVIPGDTSGTWLTTNATAAYLEFLLGAGSNALAPSANSWQVGNFDGVTGCNNNLASTSDVVKVTGFNLYPGTQVPTAAESPKLILPYDLALQRTRRYVQKHMQPVLTGFAFSTSLAAHMRMPLAVPMRDVPSAAFVGLVPITDGLVNETVASIQANTCSAEAIDLNLNTTGATMTAGRSAYTLCDGSTTKYLMLKSLL